MNLSAPSNRECLIALVNNESGQQVEKCYQCGKCTAGCPVSYAFDLMPNQVIRLIQLGMKEQVLSCRSIWLCASCAVCTARCPRNIDLAAVMDSLRGMARREGVAATGRGHNVFLFNKNFLQSIKKYGRLFELATMLSFNLKSGRPFREADAGLAMLQRGKLKFSVTRTRGQAEVARIFERVAAVESGAGKCN
ncbi:4Fe-4S dicluster domain-containing protein [Desulfotomaculum copahuensis]|uniref:Heterodisulfide reductase subunit C n=1 Tax=Desulfotomaculum copahuensis TaxID=1838280 RepID=A0A1B7LG66_9FIRM|nr:4Fe-4S dicluster domain-containing protein [Desulfotomaculum copahuensis]OAT84834.1 heterodisulfide reductase subunit C [Desulfotomaculum copahuensis]